MSKRRAIFLDKDGTLIEDVPYNVDSGKVRLLDGAVEGLRALLAAGYRIVIVSNQAGIAHGYFTPAQLVELEGNLRRLLEDHNVPIDGCYWCPHHARGRVTEFARDCDCRKPRPGLIFQAAVDMQIDLKESWMIGDILDDVEAGTRAGCRTILIDNGNETLWETNSFRTAHAVAPDLRAAAQIVLKHDDRQE